MKKWYQSLVVMSLFFGATSHCVAEQITIAVASNALAAVRKISSEFEKLTGHTVLISSGSTGKLYAQIVNGAPFDIFLAANEREPRKLEQSHLIVPGSRFTYVLGKLVAWSPDESFLQAADINKLLVSNSTIRIAIANPRTAPYGLAAEQALYKLGLWGLVQGKIIRGENVSQTYQFAMSRNAQVGFVAKSQILGNANKTKGSYWEVPEELYAAIRQQAVLLLQAQHKSAAAEFLAFIRTDKVKAVLISQFGYGIESSEANS